MSRGRGGSKGLGFAGPSNIVEAVYEQIRRQGRVRWGVVGVSAQTITPELAHALTVDRSYRVVLSDIFPGSPAERAGLRPGDIVTPGVVREDSTFWADVRVVRRRDNQLISATWPIPEEHLIDKLGILVLPLTEEVTEHVANLRLPTGAVVAASGRPPTSWGDQLKPGDVIYTIDDERVEDLDQLRSLLAPEPSGTRLLAHVLRNEQMQHLVLRTE